MKVSQIAANHGAAHLAPIVAGLAPVVPSCIRCGLKATYLLCDDAGKPMPRRAGGLCRSCAPVQSFDEENAAPGTPANLETVERASIGFHAAGRRHLGNLAAKRLERDVLAEDLALMLACADDAPDYGNGPSQADIEDARERLEELDEMLIFEPARPIILGFDDLLAGTFNPNAVS